MATAENKKFLLDYLKTHGLDYSIMVADVEKLVSAERAQMSLKRLINPTTVKRFGWTQYYSAEEIDAWVKDTVTKHSDISTVEVIGQTTENRPIHLVKISTGGSGKPSIFIDGAFHGNEWLSPAVTTYIINELLNSRAKHEAILNAFDFYIVPIVNVDGYEYSRNTDFLWRKTRSGPHGGTTCYGVDANVNFAFHFGESGSSDNPCSESYHGPKAFSEPETDALRKYVEALPDVDWVLYLSMHSNGPMFQSPWHYTTTLPEDHDEVMGIASAAIAAIKARHGKVYLAGSGGKLLYFSAGCSVDWFKDKGLKYSYTMKLRGYFAPPPDQIVDNAEEIWTGLEAILKRI